MKSTTSTSFEVRRIKPHEWAECRRIRLRMLAQAPDSFGSTADHEGSFPDEDWQAWAATRASGSYEAMFIALSGTQWIGCVTGSGGDHDDAVARVWAMWVEPDQRTLGVGRSLMQSLQRWAQDAGFSRLRLKVAEGNEPATRLYEGLGFVDTGERTGMRRDPNIGLITMEMKLESP